MILINRTRLIDWSESLTFNKKNIYKDVEWEVIKKTWLGKSFKGITLYEYCFRLCPIHPINSDYWIYHRTIVSPNDNTFEVAELVINLNF